VKTDIELRNRGFSLIEIAIVLVIISVLLAIVAIPLASQVEQRRRADTEKQLETIMEAIIGYALANGRFPCASEPADNGKESVIDESQGTCRSYSSLLPAVTLGLAPVDENGFAIDAWGLKQNRIRYAVMKIAATAGTNCPTTPVSLPFTRRDGMKAAGMNCLANYNTDSPPPIKTLITICSNTPAAVQPYCIPTKLSLAAPFVLISLAKNAPTGGLVTNDEGFNAGTRGDGTVFVSHTPTPESAPGGEFDDIVVWPSLNTIFGRMVQAGKLP